MEVKAWSYKQDSLAAGLAFLMRSSAQRLLLGALRAFERRLFRRAWSDAWFAETQNASAAAA
jgi:hypothetical protein